MYNIHFTKYFLFDVEEIVFWYENQIIGLSYDFELCLDVGIAEILKYPESFQKIYKTVKIRFINRFPYGIHYIIKKNELYVIGVFHTSRSPKNWSKRILGI